MAISTARQSPTRIKACFVIQSKGTLAIPGNTGRHKQIDAKGRGNHTKRNADDHNNTQRNGTYIKGAHHRHQNRRQHDHGGVNRHKAADNGEQNNKCEQNTSSAAEDPQEPVAQHLWHTVGGNDPVKPIGQRNDQHRGSSGNTGFNKHFYNVLQLDFSIHQHTQDQTVNDRNAGSLSGSKSTGINAAQNDYGHRNGGQAICKDLCLILKGGGVHGCGLVTVLSGNNIGVNHHGKAQHNTGNDARAEHSPHRAARKRGINNHGNAGRNNNTQAACRAHQSPRETDVISIIHHGRDHKHTQGRHGCGAAAGNCCKNHSSQNCHNSQAAPNASDKQPAEIDKPAGNSAHIHNAARQHKEWDCQQRKITGGIVALLRRQHQRGSAVSQVGHNGRKGHGKRNGRSQEHRHQEQSQQHD